MMASSLDSYKSDSDSNDDSSDTISDSELDYTSDTLDTDDLRLAAVTRNDVNKLKRLSDSTSWYDFVDPVTGNTFLHIAVFFKHKEVFRYLLSFADFPLDQKNKRGDTVLMLCFREMRYSITGEYFACELLKRGASVSGVPCSMNETLLHFTLRQQFVHVSKTLIELGYFDDLNAQNWRGLTLLWLTLDRNFSEEDATEIATCLLFHGADPTLGLHSDYNIFEYSVILKRSSMQETLFRFMYDKYNLMDMRVHLEILLILSCDRSDLFEVIVKNIKDVIVTESSFDDNDGLFSVDPRHVQDLVKYCPDTIRKILSVETLFDDFFEVVSVGRYLERLLLQNLSILLESHLRNDTLDFMHRFNDKLLMRLPADETIAFEHVSFLLSHGLTLNEKVFNKIFENFGFRKLLNAGIHMGVEPTFSQSYLKRPHLMLFYDIECNLNSILNSLSQYNRRVVPELLHYFSHAKLRSHCDRDLRPRVVDTISNQPKVPLLVELARDQSRAHLIKTFSIKSAGHFDAVLKKLPIGNVYKNIISYKMRLY